MIFIMYTQVLWAILALCGCVLVDRNDKNLGKKLIRLKGWGKFVVVRSSWKISITKPYDSYEKADDMYVKRHPEFKISVTPLALSLQILVYLFSVPAIILAVLATPMVASAINAPVVLGHLALALTGATFLLMMINGILGIVKMFRVANKFETYYKDKDQAYFDALNYKTDEDASEQVISSDECATEDNFEHTPNEDIVDE